MPRSILTTSHATRSIAISASFAALVAAAACSGDSIGPRGVGRPQLAFAASNSTGASADVIAASAITVGTHTLDLTNIAVTVQRAELKAASTSVCAGDENENEGANDDHPHGGGKGNECGELEVGPTTVNVAVNGTAATVPVNTIPAGTYRELELRLSKIELKGTFDGTAFDVTLPISAKGEFEFSPPLVIDDSTPANLTVNLPLATWFTNADGSLVDPNQLATSPSLVAQVTQRILASLRAIEDRDHDGRDDHGRDGRGGHGDNGGSGNSGSGGKGGNSGPGNGGSGGNGGHSGPG